MKRGIDDEVPAAARVRYANGDELAIDIEVNASPRFAHWHASEWDPRAIQRPDV